jgi:hypothetical protein
MTAPGFRTKASDHFDRDGYLDVMVSSSRATDRIRYFRNTGGGTFEEKTRP